MLAQSRAASGRILSTAFVYRLDGYERHFEAARRDLLNICAFPDWNPRHFLDTAEMGFAVAIGYTWLHDKLNEADRSAIRGGLYRHLLAMAPEAYKRSGRARLNWSAFDTSSSKTTNNWNFVCNSGFVAAALALRDEHPELARLVVAGARDSLPLAMTGYAPDGAWAEGPTYWDYGTAYLSKTLAMLAAETREGDAALVRLPGFDRTVFYTLQHFGPTGISFNYGDGGPVSDREGSLPSVIWLAHRFAVSEAMPEIRRRLHKRVTVPLNGFERSLPAGTLGSGLVFCAINFAETNEVDTGATLPLDAHFRGEGEFVVMRSRAADPDALWIAIKGGRNGVSHGHLDLGSFVLEAAGLRWAVDLGSDSYSLPGYWEMKDGGRRWNYFRLNNRSHNTLTLGDRLQSATAHAPVTSTRLASSARHAPDTPSATIDLTQVYPRLATKWLRHVSLPGREAILVEDEVHGLPRGESVTWRMLTPAKITLSPDGRAATLRQKGKTLKVEFAMSSPQPDARFDVAPADAPTPAEKANKGISVLSISFVPELSSVGQPLRLSVRFMPESVE